MIAVIKVQDEQKFSLERRVLGFKDTELVRS
jgi:hypothetical protein